MKWKEGGQFENPPSGTHLARCVGIIDMGTQAHNYQNQHWSQRDVRLIFQMPEVLMEGVYKPELKGTPFVISRTLNQSLFHSSKLRKLVESWKGKKMTKEEIEVFNPKDMLGKACRVALVEDGDYVNLDGVFPLSKNDKCPKQTCPLVFLSLEKDEFDPKVYGALSEKMRQKIGQSPEFKALMGTGDDDAPPSVDEDRSEDGEVPF